MLSDAPGRPFCYRCHKPQVTCICDSISPVNNTTKVWLVQHPRERFHPIGTARIARLGLSNFAQTITHRARDEAPEHLPADAALLFPGEGVPTLAELAPTERPSTLVAIDGTWHHARTVFRDNPWLQKLPRYGLEPAAPSRYRLREEPAAHCLSTIEAIVQALSVLEPDTPSLDGLLRSFETMIDEQLAIIAQRSAGHRTRRSPRSRRGIPQAILDEPERVVVVSGESAPRGNDPSSPRFALQWVASRGLLPAASDDSFEQFSCPPVDRFPNDRHCLDMGLSEEQLKQSGSQQELKEAWLEYTRKDDIIVSWNDGPLALLARAIAEPSQTLHLKSAYCSHNKSKSGSLSSLAARLGLQVPEVGGSGRAAVAVAESIAVLRHMRSAAMSS
ncbi:MAG: tRNA-uridine aminocarboxypropyltransferase [Myxococcota bacterium]